MQDKQLNALFMSLLLPAMRATVGLESVGLTRNYQQTPQGGDSAPTVYFVKIGDKRYGHTSRRDTFASVSADFQHVERQAYETTYQFSAWVPQTPADVNSLTESDVLNAVSGIMQSDAILQAYRAQGVGVLRIGDVRNPYVTDDRGRFEAVPSFDIVLTHSREVVATIPAVVAYDANLVRV